MTYPTPPDEENRLRALYRLDLLDQPPERRFDRIVDIATRLFEVPTAAVSLIDEDRQWFMASCGLMEKQTPRDQAFCTHAIMQEEVMVVEDAREDDRFADNPQVTAENGIRFYAGKPLTLEEGHRIGTLCLVDEQPRSFSAEDRATLTQLGELVEDEIQLRREVRRVRALSSALEETGEAVLITEAEPLDPPGPQITWANEAVGELTGYEPDELEGQTPRILQGEETSRSTLDKVRKQLEKGEPFETELVNYRKSGEPYIVRWSASPVEDERGELTRWVSIQRDVTDRRKREEQLEYEATHDNLTDLLDRNGFGHYLDQRLSQPLGREGDPAALLYLDLDEFKLVNDTLGHSAGDQLLQAAAQRLTDVIRADDRAARLGGDEFALLLEEARSREALEQVADRVCEALSRRYDVAGEHVYAPPSVGIVPDITGYEDPEPLLQDADLAMYRAKENTGRQHIVYEPSMREATETRLHLETDLREALEDGQFEPFYQPIVDLGSGAPVGVEVLARWHHPERGLLTPGAFLEIAEQRGLLGPLGMQVIEKALATHQSWRSDTPEISEVSVLLSANFSRREFLRPGLLEDIEQLLQKYDLKHGSFLMEITEQALHEQADRLIERAHLFEEKGLRLSLDDFGTGYTSLQLLRDLPLDMVKLDRSLLENIDASAESRKMARTVTDLVHNLGPSVVAEGIETTEELTAVRELGCELGQGYLLARPRSGEQMRQILRGPPPWQQYWTE